LQINRRTCDYVGWHTTGGWRRVPRWIEFVIPLGKDLTGNKFWDLSPAATPTYTPTPETQTCEGRVFDGDMHDESHPLTGVTVSLYVGNSDYPYLGTLLHTKDGNG
jgi:hypothetical protein